MADVKHTPLEVEMLEVLKLIVDWHGKRDPDEKLLPIEGQPDEIQRAMAIIAKARSSNDQ